MLKEYLPPIGEKQIKDLIKPRTGNKIIIKGGGNLCPECDEYMDRRGWREATAKQLSKKYYFAQWDVCRKCKRVQHYEKYKVYGGKQPWQLKIFK